MSIMSLVPDYDNSLSSSSSSSSEEVPEDRAPLQPLPKPDFLVQDPTSSVFKNVFTEAQKAKEALLQKHVKMVEAKDSLAVINGKKICWNYRKGRCRFGHNCKFAHDSDLQKSQEELQKEKQIQREVICESQTSPEPSGEELEKIREESMVEKKRKRPGLTQGLVPGKKVMKTYMKHK